MLKQKILYNFLKIIGVVGFIILIIPNTTKDVKAQGPVFDLVCPAGTSPYWVGTTVNPQTNNNKANICIDPTGTLFFNGTVATTTTALGSAQAGQVLAGPVPTGGPNNPTYETGVANQITNNANLTITGTPIVAASVEILSSTSSNGAAITAPNGFTTISNLSGTGVFYKNINSAAAQTVTWSINSSTTTNYASLQFLGGSITSVPHTANLVTSCGNGCTSGTINSLTAGNALILVATEAGTNNLGAASTITDTQGNTWQKITDNFSNPPGFGLVVYIAQFVATGNDTITLNAHNNLQNWAGVNVYELAGPTSYYTGLTGPVTPRFLTAGDIAGALGNITTKVGSGTASMTTAAIAAGACGTTVTVAQGGVATTDILTFSSNAAVTTPNGLLIINAWPTSGNVNFNYCNPTAGSLTPGSNTLNWIDSR